MLVEARHSLNIDLLKKSYASGERTPRDVLAEVMGRIARYERKNVWITVLDGAQIEKQLTRIEADRAAGKSQPLYGIPFAVKDNIDIAGVPTTAACPAFAYVPEKSAYVVQRLCDAGAVVVGKTNLDQFATGLVGTRSPYGACENSVNPEYISGGSSSGSAVAVAGGLVSFSLGTDTAGSGRVPASFNNLVGVKPTRGVLSLSGVVPACRSLDCVSIFAGTVGETRAVLEVAGAESDAGDPLARGAWERPAMVNMKGFDSLRIGIPRVSQLEFFGNAGAASLYQEAVRIAQGLKASVREIDYTPFRKAANLLYENAFVVERLQAAGKLFVEKPESLRPELRTILEGARRFGPLDVFEAQYQLAGLRRQAMTEWGDLDLLLLPTAGTIYKIAEVEADPLQLNRNLGYYTNFVNLMDLSAISVPVGTLPTGLPWGITFIGKAFEEGLLLQTGERFHAAAKERMSG